MSKNNTPNNTPDEEMYVELDLDEGTVKCSIVTIFDASYNGETKEYIALLPLGENDEPLSGDVWIYGYKEDKMDPNAEPDLIYLEDDEEYEAAADAFDEYLDAQEFDELIDDEDSDEE